jgi:hypothetical protein
MLDVKVLRSQRPDFNDDATLASLLGQASQPPATVMSKSIPRVTSPLGPELGPSLSLRAGLDAYHQGLLVVLAFDRSSFTNRMARIETFLVP